MDRTLDILMDIFDHGHHRLMALREAQTTVLMMPGYFTSRGEQRLVDALNDLGFLLQMKWDVHRAEVARVVGRA